MNRSIYSFVLIILAFSLLSLTSRAQVTAMDFGQPDCRGFSQHHLFADLDSGNIVLLHFYMSNCGMCAPPAQTIQRMANRINTMYPGLVKGYVFPFNNTTGCAYTESWVTSNGLTLYTAMDSGANAVAHYGGFGMPTVVMLGGRDHRVMYASQAFQSGDTTAMRDSILRYMGVTGLNEPNSAVSAFSVYPNPVANTMHVNITLAEAAKMAIDITDITGRQIAVIMSETNASGALSYRYDTEHLPDGIYMVRATVNGSVNAQKLIVTH